MSSLFCKTKAKDTHYCYHHFVCVCVCACTGIRVCMYVCVCVQMSVLIQVCKPESNVLHCSSGAPPSCCFKAWSLPRPGTRLGSSDSLAGWGASGICPSLPPQHCDYTHTITPRFFTWATWIKLRFSCLHGKHLLDWAISPAPYLFGIYQWFSDVWNFKSPSHLILPIKTQESDAEVKAF